MHPNSSKFRQHLPLVKLPVPEVQVRGWFRYGASPFACLTPTDGVAAAYLFGSKATDAVIFQRRRSSHWVGVTVTV